ncbi:hypothetical protein [Pyxidicoccus trucidator]|uniref:hypothetical protein n=1 Tax=Pyxidicoccus trucidator TaxID=2709662 RepID=UPI0013DD1935|nr:hypothetical protein [Pyxidicoccus trucidator]
MNFPLLNRLSQPFKPAVQPAVTERKQPLPAQAQPSPAPQPLRDTFAPARAKPLVDLQGGQQASSLLTEDARDAKRNCLDQAVDYVGKLPASEQKNAELVMLKDQRAGAEGGSGHVVVRQGEQVVDPASGKTYASTAEYLQENPQYAEAGTVSGEDATNIFATRAGSPERQAALDAAKVSPELQGMMVADDPKVLAPEDPQAVQERRIKEEAEQYDHYKAMIEKNGGTFDSAPGKRNMLAIRHDTNTKANDGKGAYDDKAVLLWVDEKGGKHCTTYNACTEPGEQMLGEDYGEAIGGDDRKDLGRLPAGSYTYHLRNDYGRELAGFFKRGPFDNEGTRQILGAPEGADWQAEYDIDHDGDFDENVRGKDGEESLWHMGREDNPRSAGCQTMPPEDWRRFLHDLDLKEDQSLNYTLVQEDPAKGNVVYSPPEEGVVVV